MLNLMQIRNSKNRGYFKNEWLESWHSFSFADYYDPRHMGFHHLRVINHDYIMPLTGFPTHPHRDMEIITYVLSGTVEHKDSLGNKTQIPAGEIQVMSAGRGIRHSEYNPSSDEVLELLQIWVLPRTSGSQPNYQQKNLRSANARGKFQKIASPNGDEGSFQIDQDLVLSAGVFDESTEIKMKPKIEKGWWIQVAQGKGSLTQEGQTHPFEKGDGIYGEGSGELHLSFKQKSEILIFEM